MLNYKVNALFRPLCRVPLSLPGLFEQLALAGLGPLIKSVKKREGWGPQGFYDFLGMCQPWTI